MDQIGTHPPGGNTVRRTCALMLMAVMLGIVSACSAGPIPESQEVSASASLTRLELAASERPSAAFELTPEFGTGTTHYAVEVPGGAADLRLMTAAEHAGSVVDVRGVAADGQPLVLDGFAVVGPCAGHEHAGNYGYRRRRNDDHRLHGRGDARAAGRRRDTSGFLTKTRAGHV